MLLGEILEGGISAVIFELQGVMCPLQLRWRPLETRREGANNIEECLKQCPCVTVGSGEVRFQSPSSTPFFVFIGLPLSVKYLSFHMFFLLRRAFQTQHISQALKAFLKQ